MLPQTDQAHVFPQLWALGQMIGRAYVHPVLLKGLGTVQIEFRPVQGKRAAPFAPLGDRCQLFFQTPIENIRAQFHAFRPPNSSENIIISPRTAVKVSPIHFVWEIPAL